MLLLRRQESWKMLPRKVLEVPGPVMTSFDKVAVHAAQPSTQPSRSCRKIRSPSDDFWMKKVVSHIGADVDLHHQTSRRLFASRFLLPSLSDNFSLGVWVLLKVVDHVFPGGQTIPNLGSRSLVFFPRVRTISEKFQTDPNCSLFFFRNSVTSGNYPDLEFPAIPTKINCEFGEKWPMSEFSATFEKSERATDILWNNVETCKNL